MGEALTFTEWLDTAVPVREHPWSKSDVRAGFEAGFLAGQAAATAEICTLKEVVEDMEMEIRVTGEYDQ